MYTPVPKGYYKTMHWKSKRHEALVHYHFTCQACGRFYGPVKAWMLDVHHLPEAYQELWHEDVRDLRLLCSRRSGWKCHKKGAYTAAEIARDRRAWRDVAVAWWCLCAPFRLCRWLARLLLKQVQVRRGGREV